MSFALQREVVNTNGGTNATTRSYALGSNAPSVAIGNLLVVAVGMASVGGSRILATPFITATTANAGAIGTWTVAMNSDGAGAAASQALCFAIVNGALTATDTINLTFGLASAPGVQIFEMSAGGRILTATKDKTAVDSGFGTTTFDSTTTAALTTADQLLIGLTIFDNSTGTNTITHEVLSPPWQPGPTAVQNVEQTVRMSYRWRDPGKTTGVRFQGSMSGAGSDWVASVVSISVTVASDIPSGGTMSSVVNRFANRVRHRTTPPYAWRAGGVLNQGYTTASRKRALMQTVGPIVAPVIDITPPVTVYVSETATKVSLITGFDTTTVTWSVDENVQAWQIRDVTGIGSPTHSDGTLVTSGSSVSAGVNQNSVVSASSLTSGDAQKTLKIFAQDMAGNWST